MQEMEKRLRDYELRGIHASSLLQASARNVARENASLRSLLRIKGVEDAEIQAWLKRSTHWSDDANHLAQPSTSATRSTSESSIPAVRGAELVATLASSISQASTDPQPLHQEACCITQQPEPPPSIQDTRLTADPSQCSNATVQKSEAPEGQRTQIRQLQSSTEKDDTSIDSSTEHDNKHKGKRNNRTPCMEAAMIIASMNSGLTMEEANAELGCLPVNDCYVDNFKVFQVMDR